MSEVIRDGQSMTPLGDGWVALQQRAARLMCDIADAADSGNWLERQQLMAELQDVEEAIARVEFLSRNTERQ